MKIFLKDLSETFYWNEYIFIMDLLSSIRLLTNKK